MQPGDTIEIRALKSDGTVYRRWQSRVESCTADSVVTVNRVGDPVGGPCGGWAFKHATRTHYWTDRQYNLAEVYQPDGRLKQIYIHIASPACIDGDALSYTDLELDVVKRPGQPLRIVDQDEFDAACMQYGYSHELQCSCRQAVGEAVDLATRWRCSGVPKSPRSRSSRSRRRRTTSSHLRQDVRTDVPASDSSRLRTDV